MIELVGISGSLRQGSFNTALLRAAAGLVADSANLTISTIEGIPLYDADKEAREGVPDAVESLKDMIADADGLILASPEYNNSIPGVFKNAIDWLSRPTTDIPRVFGGKPVAVMGASPGGFGTILSQNAWLPVLRMLGTQPWFGSRVLVSRAAEKFNEAGKLSDDATKEQLRTFMSSYIEFVQTVSTKDE